MFLQFHFDQYPNVQDGSSVLTASDECTARIWDASTGECKLTLEGHSVAVNSATFSQDGSSVFLKHSR